MLGKKGSITLEAALVIPWFVLFIFSILYIVKILYVHEQIQYAISEAAIEIANASYIFEDTELIDIQQDIYEKGSSNLSSIVENIDSIKNIPSSISVNIKQLSNIKNSFSSIQQNNGSFIEIITNLINEVNNTKNIINDSINTFYETCVNTVDSIFTNINKVDKIAASVGSKEAIQLINNAIGVQATKNIMNKHINNNNYEKWGIINGEKGLDFSKSSFLIHDNDIIIDVSYAVQIPYFKNLVKPININQSVRIKAFYGNGNFKSSYIKKEEKEEENKEDKLVYVTINGKKYHTDRNCRHIFVSLNTYTYSEIKNKKVICKECAKHVKTLRDSTIVYSTINSNKFHISKSCWTIKKSPFAITLEEAKRQGYEPCSTCGGKTK